MKKVKIKPSSGLTKSQRSKIVKKARAGKDIGKSGKAFSKIEKKAFKFYRKKGKSKGKAEQIAKETAGAQMWRQESKK
jgi:hypothetical protein